MISLFRKKQFRFSLFIVILVQVFCNNIFSQTASFTAPDTVCVNTPVAFTNTSVGATSNFWNFNVADINTTPTATNLGNIGGNFAMPDFIDYAEENGNYYAFVVNFLSPGKLVRLDFGNSLLNTPTSTVVGNIGNAFTGSPEGIQVVKNEGKWYAIIVGGAASNNTNPRIVRIAFGASLTNNNPVATDWGNIGGLTFPHDLHIFQDGTNWYGFTVNAEGNTITRFDFGTSFENKPTGINLGNVGSLSFPTGIYAVKTNNLWSVFITNAGDNTRVGTNSSLTRLDFGNSLLNTPLGFNLGNLNNQLQHPRDLTIMRFCGQTIGFLINGNPNYNNLVKLDFSNINGTPTATSLGNIGNLDFPCSISKLFRQGADIYGFITNVAGNTLTRLKFAALTGASTNISNFQTPPAIIYSTPGTYNINLTIDDGLATQSTYCKQVIVLAKPVVDVRTDTAICAGKSVTLTTTATNATTYSWSPATGLSNASVQNPIASPIIDTKYIVTASNGSYCTAKDSVTIQILTGGLCTNTNVSAGFTAPDTVCINTPVTFTNTSVGASSNYWNFCVANTNTIPTGTNLGNLGGNFQMPVFMDYVEDNGNYYGFVVNYNPGGLTRLDFGNSLLNVPTSVFLGNVGGVMNTNYGSEGIQVVKNEGRWYAFIVGGSPINAGSVPRLIKIDFGTDITNSSPVATNYGNVGGLLQCIDLHMFKEGTNWYGFTANSENNTITRFDFTSSFNNTPTAVNLGNVGNLLDYPTGIYAINDNGFWRVFVTNARTDASSSIIRLDFGSSLLNIPTAINLGNFSGAIKRPRDFTLLKYCNQVTGFVVNAGNTITRLNFSDLTTVPTANDIGNLGNLNLPHSISKLFRVGSDLYSFITNVNNNTLTRLQFTGCTNSNTPNSNLQNPPPVTYNTAGTYNINLTIDDGLATQSTFCKQIVVLPKPSLDFSFVQDVCSPLSAQFKNESTSSAPYSWDFGNGTFSSLNNPTVTYNSYNNYSVKLKTGGCADSITKQIQVRVIQDSVITNRDTTICKNSSVALNGLPALNYCWSPTLGLSSTKIANPIATPLVTTTYYLNSQSVTNNLVVNGDFSQGNAGFTSSYNYANPNLTEGQYFVGTNPNAWNPGTVACKDHTTGNGNMLLVNGAPIPDVNIWQQTITVLPNTNYAFSAWLQAIYPINPAQLQFSINGRTIGNLFSAVLPTCNWQQFYTTWNSGSNTTATISIVNKNTIVLGNDFALDDISFAELSIKRDSVTITVVDAPAVIATGDTTICESKSVPLKATGTNFYSWNQSSLLSDTTLANPIATPKVTTNFIVKGYNTFGCFSADTVVVTVLPKPILSVSKDTVICKGGIASLLATTNTGNFYWANNPSLSSTSVLNPKANPSDTAKYFITATANNTCTAKDSVTVFVVPLPTLNTIADTVVCKNSAFTLNTVSNAASFVWQPATYLSNANIASPAFLATSSIKYIVTAASINGCISKDTLNIGVSPLPTITKSADALVCVGSSKTIVTNAPTAINYRWLPTTGLNNATIASPIASPAVTTNYYIIATDINGCSQVDSVLITVKQAPVFSITPKTAIICFGDSVTINAAGADVYQWLPANNFNTSTLPKVTTTPLASTIYKVAVTDTVCILTDTLSTNIKVNQLPTVMLSKSGNANCIIGNVKLAASGAVKYRWFPTETLINATTASPIATPYQTTFYHVKAYSSEGCIKEDSIEVKVVKGLIDDGYLVPTAFTPNNDGKNDCFGVKPWGYVVDFRLSVFNRYGEAIFSTNNINDCWDGKLKGEPQPTGTYVYEIAAKTICGDVYRKGTLVLMR